MEDERKKIREPFEPGDTPRPPQEVDPAKQPKSEHPARGKGGERDNPEKKDSKRAESTHLLDENTEIDDETTI